MADMTRIILADDHPVVRNALRSLLSKEPDFDVIAEVSNGQEAIEIADKLKPDVIVMDITMPVINGLEATRQIKAKNPDISILVLTVHDDNEHVFGILQAGADGFLVKTASDKEIVYAVRALVAGDTVLSPVISRQLLNYTLQYFKKPMSSKTHFDCTTREVDIIMMAAKGMSNKEIAAKLGISLRTVKAHFTNIFLKMGVASRTEAIAVSLQAGIISLNDLEQ